VRLLPPLESVMSIHDLLANETTAIYKQTKMVVFHENVPFAHGCAWLRVVVRATVRELHLFRFGADHARFCNAPHNFQKA